MSNPSGVNCQIIVLGSVGVPLARRGGRLYKEGMGEGSGAEQDGFALEHFDGEK